MILLRNKKEDSPVTVTNIPLAGPDFEPTDDSRVDVDADPVFVLCAARSGSTLLRFLLDAHPDLACPPETNVPALCSQLATVWSLIEGAPLSQNRGDEPPDIPEAAIVGVRETMGRMVGSYLARRGKRKYCDKSLGTARYTELVTRIWPRAKFICLLRHPMDVIASGMEACPWGLYGYGFDQYIAETPGNSVFALARFWVDHATAILAAEERHADRCLRVRYEDLVADTQSVSSRIFDFLGVERIPAIEKRVFTPERERFGPADYKIWHTSKINTDSIGRGWTIPAEIIGSQVRGTLNELCEKLEYVPVDDNWGTARRPVDLRLNQPGKITAIKIPNATSHAQAAVGPSEIDLGESLEAGLERVGEDFARRWAPYAGESFELVATSAGPGPSARWLVDLSTRTIVGDGGATRPASDDGGGRQDEDDDGDLGGAWEIIGSAETWELILSGRINISVALRNNTVRYCDEDEAGPVIVGTRIGLLSDLLGIATWGQAHRNTSDPEKGETGI